MPVNWKDPDAFTRLLAAMVAAQDMKLDYRRIASMYGNGATYDSIEGRFRIIRKEAAAMKAEIDSGDRPEAPTRGAISANVTPRKIKSSNSTPRKEKTLGGRVGKINGTPTKKRGNVVKGIKKEPGSSSSSFMEVPSTEDDEDFAANVEGGLGGHGNRASQGGGVEGDGLSLYYDNDDSMDVGAF